MNVPPILALAPPAPLFARTPLGHILALARLGTLATASPAQVNFYYYLESQQTTTVSSIRYQ